MTSQEISQLKEIYNGNPKEIKYHLGVFIGKQENKEKTRTQSQHNALFLWFSMIEHEAENQGVTWDMIIRHTLQLRVTKEGLHGMCKALQKALWGTDSTKELKKIGHIDVIIDHFTDLLSKEMEFIPEFPHEKDKGNDTLSALELRKKLEKDGVI